MENKTRNPYQPTKFDEQGVLRFKENKAVRALLDHGQATGFGLNELSVKLEDECADDYNQLMQLIGYSVSGWGGLSFVNPEDYEAVMLVHSNDKDEKDARIESLENEIRILRQGFSEIQDKLDEYS